MHMEDSAFSLNNYLNTSNSNYAFCLALAIVFLSKDHKTSMILTIAWPKAKITWMRSKIATNEMKLIFITLHFFAFVTVAFQSASLFGSTKNWYAWLSDEK